MASVARKHHRRLEEAETRPKYRQGRKEKAVKVYTINQESKYLLVMGVPAIRVSEDLIKQFALYGDIEEYRHLDDYPCEEFTEVYWIKFCSISSARVAKRRLDDQSFMGGLLHVCYAPEYETVADTREKIEERRLTIENKLIELSKGPKKWSKSLTSQKPKCSQLRVETSANAKLMYPRGSPSSAVVSTPSASVVATQYADPRFYTLGEANTLSVDLSVRDSVQSTNPYPRLPPPPGTPQYRSIYPSMDPMDPDQPGPSQPKKPKLQEPRLTVASQPQVQSQTLNMHKESVGDASLVPRKIQLSKQTDKTSEKVVKKSSLSVDSMVNLGFFSTPSSDEQTVYRPYFAAVPEFVAPAAPQMGSVSLDVSACTIRQKMNQLSHMSVSSATHSWNSPNDDNNNNDKQHEKSKTQPVPPSVQPTSKRKDDKRKRI